LVLAASAFIEPLRLAERAVGGWSEDAPRELLESHVEGVVREEVRRVYPVLTVGELRDLGNHIQSAARLDDRQLHLNEDFRQVHVLLSARGVNRRSSLAAVYDLQVADRTDNEGARVAAGLDALRGCRDSVVVSE